MTEEEEADFMKTLKNTLASSRENQKAVKASIERRKEAKVLANTLICFHTSMSKHDYNNLPERSRKGLDRLYGMAIEYMNKHA